MLCVGGWIWTGAVAVRAARACLAPTLDQRAVQWSTAVVEAKLVRVGDPVAIDAATITPGGREPTTTRAAASSHPSDPAAGAILASAATSSSDGNGTANPNGNGADQGVPGPLAQAYVLYSLEVTEVFDGRLERGEPLRIIRLIHSDAEPSTCSAALKEGKVGDTFVLLVRPANQTQLAVAPNAIAPGTRADAMVAVHVLRRADMTPAEVRALRQLISDAHQNERSATPAVIDTQVQTLATAEDAVKSGDAEKALRLVGATAAPALRERLNDPSLPENGRGRVRRLYEDLAVPPLRAER